MASQYRRNAAILLHEIVLYQLMFSIALTTINFSSAASEKAYPNPLAPIWCFRCSPGHYISTHCSVHLTNSSCLPCPVGQYARTPNNRTFCQKCATCPDNSMVIQSCNSTSDIVCQCQEGFHKFPLDAIGPFFNCVLHTNCTHVQGEVYPGNFTHDRLCRNCTPGEEFVNAGQQSCQKCTNCQDQIKPCSIHADTICNQTIMAMEETSSIPPDLTEEPTISLGLIIGIVLGVLIAIIAVLSLVYVILRKFYRRNRSENRRSENDVPLQVQEQEHLTVGDQKV